MHHTKIKINKISSKPSQFVDDLHPSIERPEDETTTPTKGDRKKKQSVIVDTDIANFSDDFWALAYLMACPDIDIKYIITCGGDTSVKTRILAKFLAHCGHSDIPIGTGPSSKEMPYLVPNDHGHLLPRQTFVEHAKPNPIMKEWGADYDTTKHNAPVYDESESIQQLHNELKSCKANEEPVTLILMGTAENMSQLLDHDEDILRGNGDNVSLISMGGTITGDEEYNYMLRPNDARRMLRACPQALVVTADVCLDGTALQLGNVHNRCMYSKFLMGDSQIAITMAQVELALANFGTHKEVADGRTDILFDALTAFVGTRINKCMDDSSSTSDEMFAVEKGSFVISDMGVIEPTTDDDVDGIKMHVVSGWNETGCDVCPKLLFQQKLVTTILDAPRPSTVVRNEKLQE